MQYLIGLCGILFIILIVICIKSKQLKLLLYSQNKQKEILNQQYNEFVKELDAQCQQHKEDAEKQMQAARVNSERVVSLCNQRSNDAQAHFIQIEKEIQAKIQLLEQEQSTLIESKEEQIDLNLEIYYQQEINKYTQMLKDMQESALEGARAEYAEAYTELSSQLSQLAAELEGYQLRRAAINEEILRQRALDEQQDFYRICITDTELQDISILLDLKTKLHKTDFLNKIIYDTYVSKYVKEMSKRVLAGRNPSGIYKVTNTQTKEVYIGKSTTVSDRWANHCKSAFGLEGVADSQFQRALKKYGVQSFTWELLEEVPKDQLGEREKYYISFYDTTKYGYNQRIG